MEEKLNRIEKFMAKSKEIEIEGEKFIIKALKTKDINLIAQLDITANREEAIGRIITKILRDNFPEITQEQIDNFALQYLEPLMSAFSEVNNLDEKISKDIQERLKQLKKRE